MAKPYSDDFRQKVIQKVIAATDLDGLKKSSKPLTAEYNYTFLIKFTANRLSSADNSNVWTHNAFVTHNNAFVTCNNAFVTRNNALFTGRNAIVTPHN